MVQSFGREDKGYTMVSKVVSWKLKAHDALREVAIGQALEVSQSDHRVFDL